MKTFIVAGFSKAAGEEHYVRDFSIGIGIISALGIDRDKERANMAVSRMFAAIGHTCIIKHTSLAE